MRGLALGTVKKELRVRHWSIAALLLSISVPAFGQTANAQALRVYEGGTITPRVARMNGILAKYGIEVQTLTGFSSDSMRADLANGKLDIVDDGLDNAVAMVLAGADVIIVTASSHADQELIAQPEIKSAKDLRGKTIIVDDPNTQNALMMKKILSASGLKPDGEKLTTPEELSHTLANSCERFRQDSCQRTMPVLALMAANRGLGTVACVTQRLMHGARNACAVFG